MKKPDRKAVLRSIALGSALAAVGIVILDQQSPPPEVEWSILARTESEEVSYSRISDLIRNSGETDRAVIYTDMIVFEQRYPAFTEEGGDVVPDGRAAPDGEAAADPPIDEAEALRYRASLNYNIIGNQGVTFDGVAADISFGNAPSVFCKRCVIPVGLLD